MNACYIMIHTFTSGFLYHHFEKVKMKLFHSARTSSQGRGKSKVNYNDSQNIPGLYFKYFTIFLKILWKPFFKEKQCGCDKKYFSGRVNLRLNNDRVLLYTGIFLLASLSTYLSLNSFPVYNLVFYLEFVPLSITLLSKDDDS